MTADQPRDAAIAALREAAEVTVGRFLDTTASLAGVHVAALNDLRDALDALAAAPETPREAAIAYPGNPHDSPIWQELADALDKAMIRHAPMHSPHEGHSVIREELDELWEHVRGDTGRSTEARKEAIQIAAMGLRYALDLCVEEATRP